VHLSTAAARLPDPAILHYAAAKAALRAVSKGLAHESSGAARRAIERRVARADANAPLERPGRIRRRLAARFDKPRETAIRRPRHRCARPCNRATRDAGRRGQPIALVMSPLSAQVTGAEWAIDSGALREV
jgi:NAD(P)-dependent dehydrogenase (short-subunit alcohol dehydrogenase family)